jgi:WD40 repeat protein
LLIGAITGVAMVGILILVVTLFAPGHARSPAALSGTLAGTLTDPSGFTARGVAFSSDDKTIAGTFGPSGQGAGHVDVWTSAGGHPAAVLASPSGGGGPAGLAFSPTSAAALAVGGETGVSLWNVTARQSRTYPTPGHSAVGSVAFAPDGATIAALGTGGDVDRLTVATGDWLTGQFTASPDSVHQGSAATGSAGQVSASQITASQSQATQVTYSPDGALLAVADGTGTVRVWHTSAGSPAVINGAAAAPVNQPVAFSPDSKTLAVIASNGQVRLWNVASKSFTATLAGPGKFPRAVAFAPDGATLAVADADGQVYLWDLSTSRPVSVATPLSAGGGATALAFSPDGKILAVAGDQSAKVYLYTVRYAGT